MRVDHSLSSKHQVFGRYYYTRDDALNPNWFGNEANSGNFGLLQDVYSISADYIYTIGPTLLFTARYGYTQRTHKNLSRSLGIDLTKLGFPSYVQKENPETTYPSISLSPYASQGWADGINAFDYVVHSFQTSTTKMTSTHALKFGADIRYNAVPQDRGIDLSGSYSFNTGYTRGPNANRGGANAGDSFASMLLGTPASGTFGTLLKVKGANDYWSFYIQDDWHATTRLTLNIGLRYELERPRTEQFDRLDWFDFDVRSPLNDSVKGLGELRGGLRFAAVDGNPRRQFDTDWNNFAPRFGFAYQLRPKTVVRGAYGIFYGSGSVGAGGWNIASQGFAPSTSFVGTIDGFKPIVTLSNPFPDGFAKPVGNSEGLLSLAGQAIPRVFDRNAPLPYNQQWNMTIQKEFGRTLVEVGYLGSRGVHLGDGAGHEINQLLPQTLALGTELQRTVANPFYGVITNPGTLSQPQVQTGQLLRPYPQFANMVIFNPAAAASTYHGFTAKVERRFSSGVGFLVSYTSSKNISDAPATVGPASGHQNNYDRRADRSLVEEDIAQRFIASASWELPFGHGKAFGSRWNPFVDGVLGGWQVNGIVLSQSGPPLPITNTPNNLNAFGGTQRPNSKGFSAARSGRVQDRLDQFLDPSAFSAPGPFNFGNASRILPDVRGPRLSNFDFSLFKMFSLTESLRLQFRGEFFNAFNSPMFNLPNTAFGGTTFGRITSQSNEPRHLRLALRLMF